MFKTEGGFDCSGGFHGVRFALFGFDPSTRDEVREKLISEGGVDVGQYKNGRDCTHVIVDKIVYDDPVCVAARRDRKKLVNRLWVDHSLEVGMPLDDAPVMYKPLKDLNGIPGAQDFVMCLTGYNRPVRDDIMIMVGLMGAQFSKPLVANKVTHLICYKFEGEKYELAKRLNTIRLVNHRWLEDCLKAWELLPEDNYKLSGHELEVMEAEAKDSEEETEDIEATSRVNKSNISPHALTNKVQGNQGVISKSESMQTKAAAVKEVGSGKESMLNCVQQISQQAALEEAVNENGTKSCNLNVTNSKVPLSINVDRNDPSSANLKSSGDTDSVRLAAFSYSRKTPKQSGLSLYAKGNSGNVGGHLSADFNEHKLSDGFKSSPSKFQLGRDTADFQNKAELNGSSSRKRKTDSLLNVSPVASKSPKVGALSAKESKDVKEPTTLMENSVSVGVKASYVDDAWKTPVSDKTKASFADKEFPECDLAASGISASKTLEGSVFVNKVAEASVGKSRLLATETSDGINDVTAGCQTGTFAEEGDLQNQLKNAGILSPCLNETLSKVGGSESISGKGLSNSHTRPLQKRITKKSLGSRTKPNSGLPANKKGSIYLGEAPSLDDAMHTGDLGKAGDRMNCTTANKNDKISATIDAENNTEPMDDETQPPEFADLDTVDGKSKASEFKNVDTDDGNPRASEFSDTAKAVAGDVADPHNTVSHDNAGPSDENEELVCNRNTNQSASVLKLDATTAKLVKGKKKVSGKAKGADVQTVLENKMPPNAEVAGQIESAEKTEIEKKQKKRILHSTHKTGNRPQNKKKSPVSKGTEVDQTVLEKEMLPNAETAGEIENVKKTEIEKKQKKRVLHSTHSTRNRPQNKKKSPVSKGTEVDQTVLEKEMLPNAETAGEIENVKKTETEKMQKKRVLNSTDNIRNLPQVKKKSPATKAMEVGKENEPVENAPDVCMVDKRITKFTASFSKAAKNVRQDASVQAVNLSKEPAWFILSGHKLQKKEFQKLIKQLRGRLCRDSHQWSYQATHFIVPDPIRRTEKFFAAAASGSWILTTDYLTASAEAGKFLAEEPYEWHKKGLSEDGAINMEAPRKWRLLKERTGHGAFYGMHIIIYGECIAPPLDTLKRAVKAGDGVILATSPPYTRFLNSGVDFAIVSPGMPRVDMWVQEFLRHEIPCVLADYIVEYVCKSGYPLERHVQYNTHEWAAKSLASLQARSEEIVPGHNDPTSTISGKNQQVNTGSDDTEACHVCGATDREEVMIICGDENGSKGCGVGVHIDCCDPPLDKVPEGDWFCPKCSTEADATKNKKKKKKAAKSKIK